MLPSNLFDPVTTQDIDQLKLETDQQRKTNFLNPLVISLIILQSIAVLIMITPPLTTWYWFVIVGLSLGLNLIVFYLTKVKFIGLATHLFCHNFNGFIFFSLIVNLTVDKNYDDAILVSYLFALSILLAGLLIGPRANFGFTVLNTIFIFFPYLIASNTVVDAINITFSVMVFLYLIALISWLYQRTLNKAQDQLNEAHRQLTRTKVLQREVKIAQELQQRLYREAPHIGKQFAVACRSKPAYETIGDFYDFVELVPSHEWGIIVGDVAGKSLPAAMVMTTAYTILRSECRRHPSPAITLRHTNQIMAKDSRIDLMVTAFYGILNLHTQAIDFSNAGHMWPILKRNEQVEDLELKGPPLNSGLEIAFEERRVKLEPGDHLILTTDGMVEAMNVDGELFGFDRLAQAVCSLDTTNPQEVLETIWQAVTTFCGQTDPHDDMTIVVVSMQDKESEGERI